MSRNKPSHPAAPIARTLRWIRFVVMGLLFAGAGYLVIRFDTIYISSTDNTVSPIYTPNSSLLIDTWDPLAEGGSHHAAFRIAGEDAFRIGRVIARAGQRIHRLPSPSGFELAVDGVSTGILIRPFDEAGNCELVVPAEQVYLISLVPGSEVPDSRTLGPFRKQQLAGRVLVGLPW